MSLIMVIITQIYFRAVSNNVLIEIVRTTQANSETINTQLRQPVKEFSRTLATAVNPVQLVHLEVSKWENLYSVPNKPVTR